MLRQSLIALEDAHLHCDKYQDEDARLSVINQIRELLTQPEPFTPDWVSYRQGVEDATRKPLSNKWLRDNIHLIHKDVSFTDLVRAIEKSTRHRSR